MDPLILSWPGGEHPFALPIGRLRAVQEAVNAGPEEVFNRLRLGTWRVDDVVHVLRQGLIGGGMDPAKAAALVAGLLDLHPWADFKMPAYAVIRHAILGPEDDQVGKPDGVGDPAPENGSSPNSMEPEPSLG